MEVVRKNFKETLPLICDSIDKADFLAIDAEFTGLINGRDVSIFDLPEEYYVHVVNGCSEFMLIQFGLCAFYWDEKKKHYMHDAYNFYLFPRGRLAPDRMFLCQSSSLDFLAANGFDFNKLIKEGISYMTEPTETKQRETLTKKQSMYTKEKEPLKIPDENKQQIEDICNRVKKFIEDKTSDEMEIDRVNAFIRLLLFQELRGRFKNDILVDIKILENKNRVLKVTRKKPDVDEEDQDKLRKEKEWSEFEDAVGFSKVARMISQSEKLVIGHNMLLDVIHTLNHFFQPLPTDYKLFKEFAHCMFPKLIDTKYISSLPPFKEKLNSSALPDVLAALTEPPFSIPKVGYREGFGYRVSGDKCHEAGYDAYVTGLCFLGLHAHVTRLRGDRPDTARVQSSATCLKPFLNKLFLWKTARQDSPYINLTGPDPSPSRDHVFYLTFPKDWQRSDINQLFSPFGNIVVQFLDDGSALVALDRRDQASDVLRVLNKHTKISLIPYNKYKKSVHRTEAQRPDPYRLTKTNSETKSQQVSSNVSSPRPSQQLPEKVSRERSNSTSIAGPGQVSPPARKRTSSGEPQEQSVKVVRTRSNSTSMTAPGQVSPPARKRTSSGVFQVDESEPLAKKSELTASLSDSSRMMSEIVGNACRETIERSDKEKLEEMKRVQLSWRNMIDKFDSEAKSNCVSAFKESDSWE